MAEQTPMEPGRVLIARTNGDRSFETLARLLRRSGFRTQLEVGSPFTEVEGQRKNHVPAGVKAVWVVQHFQDNPAEIDRDIDSYTQLLGRDHVGLLVEEAVPDEAVPTDYRSVRYAAGQADTVMDDITKRLPYMGISDSNDSFKRLAMAQRNSVRASLFVPAVMVGLIVFLAAVASILSVLSDGGTESVASADPSMARIEVDLFSALAQYGSDPFAIVDRAPVIGELGLEALPSALELDAPAGPATSDGVDQYGLSLPSTCRLDLTKGVVIPPSTSCDDGGVIVRDGDPGPWHNDVAAIVLTEGVVGSTRYEATGTIVALRQGTTLLNSSQSAYGLDYLELSFSGDQQHVHLFEGPETGARSATITFQFAP